MIYDENKNYFEFELHGICAQLEEYNQELEAENKRLKTLDDNIKREIKRLRERCHIKYEFINTSDMHKLAYLESIFNPEQD
jgi:flagellar motility protein MotE (MotC chaperone)